MFLNAGRARRDAGVLKIAARGGSRGREQRCWWHKFGDVVAALPKSAHPSANPALAEICNAEDKDHAPAATKGFTANY